MQIQNRNPDQIAFLQKREIERSPCYAAVQSFYGSTKARRSGVPYMNHINEGGIVILAYAGQETYYDWPVAWEAFALHPILQADKDLQRYTRFVTRRIDHHALVTAMEYRERANAWLSDKVVDGIPQGAPHPGVLPATKLALIADKVQNYKDFLTYHAHRHERSGDLYIYFESWLNALGVSKDFVELCKLIDQTKPLLET